MPEEGNKETILKQQEGGVDLGVVEHGFRLQQLEQKVKEFDQKIDKDKTSLFTVFGIFASIITFFSVEVQILQKAISFDQLVFLSLLLLFGLLGFITLLQWVVKTWIENNEHRKAFEPLYIVLLILIIGLLIFGYRSIQVDNNQVFFNTYIQ